MDVLATLRPDDWNLALFVHVLGAFAAVGALVLAASYLFMARRDGSVELTRLGYRSLLFGALPAYVVLRVGAQWLASKEGVEDSDAAWITIGYLATDIGLLFLLISTVATGLAVRRAGRDGRIGGGVGVAAWLVAVLIVAYAVAIWAMAAKPA